MNHFYTQLIVIIVTALIGYLSWLVQYQKNMIRDVQNQLSERKFLVYSQILEIFFVSNKVLSKKVKREVLQRKIEEIKKGVFIYGSDELIKKYIE